MRRPRLAGFAAPVAVCALLVTACGTAAPGGTGAPPLSGTAPDTAPRGKPAAPVAASSPFSPLDSAPVSRAAAPASATPAWNAPDPSLRARPSEVVGAVAAGERVRVIGLQSVGGKPVVSVTTAVGPQAAVAAVSQAQRAAGSLAVSVDRRRTALGQPVSNDTYRGAQWALTKLAAEDTWQYSRGSGVTVAVIDTGVSAVPDLAGQLLPGQDLVAGSGNGTNDLHGHGTHVGGIIAAVADNSLGVAGLAPAAKILPLRVLDSSGSGYDSNIATALIYAADHGAGIANLSLGGPDADPVLASAVSYAQSKNVVVVAAAGNSRQSGNAHELPGGLPERACRRCDRQQRQHRVVLQHRQLREDRGSGCPHPVDVPERLRVHGRHFDGDALRGGRRGAGPRGGAGVERLGRHCRSHEHGPRPRPRGPR